MVDWDELRYLLAVRRAGSLLAAARVLGVDKATVSRRIGSLEATLGVRLFDRRPDGYRLTPYGERTLAAVDTIDGTVAALVAELSDARGDEGGRVYLSVPQFFASQVLLPAVLRFRQAHPRIELVINASSSLLNIAQREAEVGLRNVKPDQLSVTVRRVGVLGMAFYASQRYLDRRGKPKESRDLAGHDLIGWESSFTQAKALLWANDFGTRVLVRVNDAAVMCDAVAADSASRCFPASSATKGRDWSGSNRWGRAATRSTPLRPGSSDVLVASGPSSTSSSTRGPTTSDAWSANGGPRQWTGHAAGGCVRQGRRCADGTRRLGSSVARELRWCSLDVSGRIRASGRFGLPLACRHPRLPRVARAPSEARTRTARPARRETARRSGRCGPRPAGARWPAPVPARAWRCRRLERTARTGRARARAAGRAPYRRPRTERRAQPPKSRRGPHAAAARPCA